MHKIYYVITAGYFHKWKSLKPMKIKSLCKILIFFVQIMIYIYLCVVCIILCFFLGDILFHIPSVCGRRHPLYYSVIIAFGVVSLRSIVGRTIIALESETNPREHLHYFHFVYYLYKNKFNRMSDTIKFLIKLNYVSHLRTE